MSIPPVLLLSGAVTGVASIVGVSWAYRHHLAHGYLIALGTILVGYAFLGRTFAYVGIAPLYVGELMLMLGGVAAVLVGRWRPLLSLPTTWLLIALMAWGSVCTVPFVKVYGLDALRDGAQWGYALFALWVAALLPHARVFLSAVRTYGRLMPLYVAWVPVFATLAALGLESAFQIGPGIPWLTFKRGDLAVHVAGAGAYLVLDIFRIVESPGHVAKFQSRVLLWSGWTVSFMILAAATRGGALAMIAALAVPVLLGPRAAIRRLIAPIAAMSLLGIALAAFDVRMATPSGREFSPRQVGSNLLSVLGGGSDHEGGLEQNRTWRLNWWSDIVGYTVDGPYFWTGKGFGINLAEEDGYQVNEDHSLRLPHSVHMAWLARAGVPGLALWCSVQLALVAMLVSMARAARRSGDEARHRLLLWMLAYWIAFIVNASFDNYLENPYGGIWFWCLSGAILALSAASSRRTNAVSP